MWLDGVPVRGDEMGVLALVNYGHFTTMRVEDARVRGLDLHLDRLVHDCRTIFGAELDPVRVRRLARQAAEEASPATAGGPARTGDGAVAMRITVFDPDLGLARPAATARPRVLVTVRPVPDDAPPPIRLRSVRYARDLPVVKHTGLFGVVHQRRLAQLAGYDDALLVDADGRVTEGTTWNIAFVDGVTVTWPAGEYLHGVTMRLLDVALGRLGVAARTAPVPLAVGKHGAFITNAAIGLRAVGSIDGVDLADSSALIGALRREYDAIEGDPL